MLFLLIPATNALICLAHHNNLSEHYAALTLASGMASGVALMYSLMFLPILPISLLTSLIIVGWFGLSPFLAIPCCFIAGKAICQLAEPRTYFNPHQVEHIGHLIVLVMIIAIELPSTMTRIYLDMANRTDTSASAIQWLRLYGNQDVMLRACYERSGRATDVLGSLYQSASPLKVDDARHIFYRVTGKPFNAVPIPASARATIQHAGLAEDIAGVNAQVDDEFDLDANIGGESVSGQARGLFAQDSLIAVKADPDALLARVDWSILLSNTSKYDREARGKLHLPPGAVLNRVAVKIGDKEREAQIMLRGKARVQYVKSIKKHLDPLLVSTSGPNEVLIQCFPVQPAVPVTIKVSMICPMALKGLDKGCLELPVMSEENFHEPTSTRLTVGSTAIVTVNESHTTEKDAQISGQSPLTTELDPTRMAQFAYSIVCKRDKSCTSAYAADQLNGDLVTRTIKPDEHPMPRKLIVVVDGSAAIAKYIREIAQGLKYIPRDSSIELYKIGDDSTNKAICGDVHANDSTYLSALANLENGEYVGGQDDSEILIPQTKLAFTDKAILWIHGAQPVCGPTKWTLNSSLNTGRAQPLIYDFQVEAGPVAMTQNLNPSASLITVPRVDTVESDLRSLFSTWRSDWQRTPIFTRQPDQETVGHLTPLELPQLAAYDQIIQDLDSPTATVDSESWGDAVKLADQYHLVSPVSSAIVKTMEDKAKDEKEQKIAVAVGPEADTWLLLLVVAGILIMQMRADKRKKEAMA